MQVILYHNYLLYSCHRDAPRHSWTGKHIVKIFLSEFPKAFWSFIIILKSSAPGPHVALCLLLSQPPTDTNDGAEFLPMTPIMGPNDTNDRVQFLPMTATMRHNCSYWHQRWGIVYSHWHQDLFQLPMYTVWPPLSLKNSTLAICLENLKTPVKKQRWHTINGF